MTDIMIRSLKIEDRERMIAFFRNVLEHTFNANGFGDMKEFIEEEIKDKSLCLEQYYKTEGEERYFLIATDRDRIVGCIEYGSPNELLVCCTKGKLTEMPEIGTVFVDPEYQRRGIASLMLRSIFEVLLSKGIKSVCFDSGYPIAQSIWTRMFGDPEYFLKDYWDKGAHHMVWIIDIENAFS